LFFSKLHLPKINSINGVFLVQPAATAPHPSLQNTFSGFSLTCPPGTLSLKGEEDNELIYSPLPTSGEAGGGIFWYSFEERGMEKWIFLV
jgi:hypothetical protein